MFITTADIYYLTKYLGILKLNFNQVEIIVKQLKNVFYLIFLIIIKKFKQ